MPDRIFYDAVTAGKIPKNPQGVMGYVDGLYKWSDKDWALFGPSVVKVPIAVFASTNDGHVLDVEQGDATPAQSVDWVLMRRKAGVDPTVYCNMSTWPEVRAAFKARSVTEPHYWVAQYDNVPSIPPGAIGKQYFNDDALGYDMSAIADPWPGVDNRISAIADSVRRNDMHVDLEPGVATAFTNPAAVLGGTAEMCIACDFGDVTVRVATFSFSKNGWTVNSYPLTSTGGALKIEIPGDTNKVSVLVTQGEAAVGLDVFA